MPNTNLLAALALSTSLVACVDDASPQPDMLALPGAAYFPESLHAADDGTLYVGSLATGQVVAYDNGSEAPRTILAAGHDGITGVTGVHVAGSTLWLCSVDTTFQRPTEVRSFSRTGTPIATYALPPTAFCNDLELDTTGAVYATDSFGGAIYKLPAGGDAFAPFVQDARFAPDSQNAFGLDGIVLAGDAFVINKLDTGELFRVALDGSISEITPSTPLAGPDAMRALDAHTLLVVEGNANRLSKLVLHGDTATVTPVATDLDMPTGVVVSRGSAWVSEGQLGRLFTQQTPNIPFSVRRIDL